MTISFSGRNLMWEFLPSRPFFSMWESKGLDSFLLVVLPFLETPPSSLLPANRRGKKRVRKNTFPNHRYLDIHHLYS